MRPFSPFCAALLLAGCGGGGGSNGSDGKSRVTIDWPATTRAFEGSPLAGSARVVFTDPTTNAVVQDTAVVRPSGTAKTSKTYTLDGKLTPNVYFLTVVFCNGAEGDATKAVGLGSTVATVRSDGRLRDGEGKALPDVAFTSTLKSIAIAPGQSVTVGQKSSLVVTAVTSADGTVSVPFGFVDFDLVSGGSVLRADDDGTVTGLAPGNATIVAKAFGKTSLATPVSVTVP